MIYEYENALTKCITLYANLKLNKNRNYEKNPYLVAFVSSIKR